MMKIYVAWSIVVLTLFNLGSTAFARETRSLGLVGLYERTTRELDHERHHTLAKIEKRTPGNCVGKLCGVRPQSGDTAAAHGQRARSSTAQSQISETHDVGRHSPPQPRGREHENESTGENHTPEATMLGQQTPDTLHETSRSSGAASPSLHPSNNSIASLTETLYQDHHERPLSVQSGRPPLPGSRSDRDRSTAPSSFYSFDASSQHREIRHSHPPPPRAIVGSPRGRTHHQHLQDAAGPSSVHTSTSAHGNLTPEEEGRLQRAIRGWQTMMGEHVGHRWGPDAKAEFHQLVHEHVEPFRAGRVTAAEIDALRERKERDVRNLLASEVAMSQVAKSFPNHARRLQKPSLGLTRPSNHDRLAAMIQHWQERHSGPSSQHL